MYGVAWAEFSTRHASGWPNGQDNYDRPRPAVPFAEYTSSSWARHRADARRRPGGPGAATAQALGEGPI